MINIEQKDQKNQKRCHTPSCKRIAWQGKYCNKCLFDQKMKDLNNLNNLSNLNNENNNGGNKK